MMQLSNVLNTIQNPQILSQKEKVPLTKYLPSFVLEADTKY